MDEKLESQDLVANTFKAAESDRPDSLLEPNYVGVIAIVPDEDLQNTEHKVAEVSAPILVASPTVQAPHIDSISNIDRSTLNFSLQKTKSIKKPMTPGRFLTFIVGLFLVGVAGNLSRVPISAAIESAFQPQYVKDFHQAEALLEKDQAFSGMRNALAQGEKEESQSRRFTNLVASFADQLDGNARYLEAETEWARAANPSGAAPPDLRELKSSPILFAISAAYVWRIGGHRTFENVNKAKYKKGESLLRTKFGLFHGALL